VSIFLYFCVIGIASVGIAFALEITLDAAIELSQQVQQAQQTPHERTLLDLRIKSSREVRQSLARPIPTPEPLPPITAHVRHAMGSVAAASKLDHSASRTEEFRNAFASSAFNSRSHVRPSESIDFDRHAVQ
jgi:hypothetical protein